MEKEKTIINRNSETDLSDPSQRYSTRVLRYPDGVINLMQDSINCDLSDTILLTVNQIRQLNEFANNVQVLTVKEISDIIEKLNAKVPVING